MCKYRAHALAKYTIFKKNTQILSISLHLYIKFQVKNLSNKGAIKKTKFLTYLNL
jgi:hypothetical protein